uniref:Uncharacterized protein n=1 Tax=Arundo donax TaxID=35708 RepID=A0A0A9HC39_ARUDO
MTPWKCGLDTPIQISPSVLPRALLFHYSGFLNSKLLPLHFYNIMRCPI